MNEIIAQDLECIIQQDIPWDYFDGKTVLVTGATGMLATYLVETILFLNKKLDISANVLALSRSKEAAESRFKHHLDNKHLMHINCDLNDSILIRENFNIVMHAASYASPKYYNSDPVGTIKPNVLGTANLLDISIQKKAEKFLYFSSGEIYGEQCEEGGVLYEDSYGIVDPLSLRSCYAESKRMAETMCVAWSEQYGLDVKIVRPFHAYGPGMKLDDGRVFADFISNIVNKENIVLKSKGEFKRPFCYISDATKAFFTVLLKGESKSAYNVANPSQSIKIKELASILQDAYTDRGVSVEYDIPDSQAILPSKVSEQLPDIGKTIALGWKPEVGVKEGFMRTVKSYE